MSATIPAVPQIKLLGAKEVGDKLGVSKSRVTQLRTEGILPTPIADLASGPVWDAEAISEFKKSWTRQGGRVRPVKHRYVEMAFYDDTNEPQPRFMAVLVDAATPNEAVIEAKAEVKAKHPNARRISEFMQRTITAKKAKLIQAQFDNKTWEGWDFGRGEVA